MKIESGIIPCFCPSEYCSFYKETKAHILKIGCYTVQVNEKTIIPPHFLDPKTTPCFYDVLEAMYTIKRKYGWNFEHYKEEIKHYEVCNDNCDFYLPYSKWCARYDNAVEEGQKCLREKLELGD